MSYATSKNGHAIVEFSKGWSVVLPKAQNPTVLWGEIGYKKITAAQAAKLLAGESIELKGLKGKTGKPFDAFVSYNFETRKTEYKFIDKPKKYVEAGKSSSPSATKTAVKEEEIFGDDDESDMYT